MKLLDRILAAALLVFGICHPITAQEGPAIPPRTETIIALVNVNVIRMDRERVEPARTVIVTGGRITTIGDAADVRIPAGARIIEGIGRYLVPGLTDAHVHLSTDMPWAPARPDFGDAPLYLAHGITTVINLRGSPTQLAWRRLIETGDLAGPTIYTSGEFVNEPRVNTPDEVAQEVEAQRRAGYDLIKFHEVWKPGQGFLTTKGLSRPAYLKMNDTARVLGLPLVGHAPVSLGLEALLQGRQPLAHMGMLSNIYFLPLAGNRLWTIITAVAFAALTIFMIAAGVAAVIRRWRSAVPCRPKTLSRTRNLIAVAWMAGVLEILCAALFLPGGRLFESLALRLVFTLSLLVAAVASATASVSVIAVWRHSSTSMIARWHTTLTVMASLAFASAGVMFWLPVAWRSSNGSIQRLAQHLKHAGIPVQTTLVAYDAIGGPDRLRLVQDPMIEHLHPETRAIWRRVGLATSGPPGYRYTDFMKKVAGALHRAGVQLMAGTDAMGLALVAPGSSLHRELELLTESGLTPYEAMYAATVAPAEFLGKDSEFGTLEIGKRADVLLINGNPLEDLTRLRHPVGVMTRGRWFSREQLDKMLARMARER